MTPRDWAMYGLSATAYRGSGMSGAPDNGRISFRVHQATGIVSVQAGCSVDDALLLLVERAYELQRLVELVARDVIEHVIRFDA